MKTLIAFLLLITLAGCSPSKPESSKKDEKTEQVSEEEKQEKIENAIKKHPHGELLSKEIVNQSVEEIIAEAAKEFDMPAESYQVAYKDLQSGEIYNYQEQKIVQAASTIKVGIAVLIVDRIESGLWDYETEAYYDLSDYEPGAGEVTEGPYGVYYPIEFLLEQMIVESDNTATNILFKFYQTQTGKNLREEINRRVDITPFPVEFSQNNVITAEILELYLELLLQDKKYQPIIEWMKKTERTENFKNYIQLEMATKHGINDFAHHDIGILFDGKTPLYTLVILTDGAQPRSNEFMATANLRLSFRSQMRQL